MLYSAPPFAACAYVGQSVFTEYTLYESSVPNVPRKFQVLSSMI